ncbi:MAG TPA: hypothetical protein VFU15_09380, partial [Bacteroidia bacterium]|nr:hypothetical protein [Bacteroidia bacterium]
MFYRTLFLLFIAYGFLWYDTNPFPGWKKQRVPTEKEADDRNSSGNDWHVYIAGGNIRVARDSSGWLEGPRPPFDPDTIGEAAQKDPFRIPPMGCFRPVCSMRVNDGWLFGTDHGEWGGCLRFTDSLGRSTYEIASGNFKSIISVSGRFFVVEGLMHMSMSVGKIIELTEENGKWGVA